MEKESLKSLENLAKIISEIDQNKLWIILIAIIVLGCGYLIRYYLVWRKERSIENSLEKISKSTLRVNDSVTNHENSSGMRMEKLVSIMEEIRDRQKNVISKSDSIRIILNKFNDVVKREVISIFEWSIINNNYETRKEFVRKKIKTALAEVIILAKKSLSEFNLSVELDKFFITYVNEKDSNVHFKLVDLLWDDVEPIYHKEKYGGDNIEEQQLEEMQIAVNNVITAELTKIQMEINNLYR